MTAITATEFAYIRQLVHDQAAIQLEEGKEYLVESRLAPLARSNGMSSLAELVGRLRASGPSSQLMMQVVEAMTTNETSFFRDPAVFEGIRLGLLPDMIKRRTAVRRLSIWSAACSTGQEAYSLIMLMREHFPELATWKVDVIGTDLSTAVVAKAKAGVYSQFEVNRGLPAALLNRYFDRQGVNWQLKPAVRGAADFRQLNLISAPMLPRADLVLLRNVLIYFDDATRRRLLGRINDALSPDGYLLLGSSETPLLQGMPQFERTEFGRAVAHRRSGVSRRPVA
jgi:chemotaxis protein methyltransferase CheR